MPGITHMSWLDDHGTLRRLHRHWRGIRRCTPAIARSSAVSIRPRASTQTCLRLCRLRIEHLHDMASDEGERWRSLQATQARAVRSGDASELDAPQRAALRLAENIPFAPHAVTDADVAAAKAHFRRCRHGHAVDRLRFF